MTAALWAVAGLAAAWFWLGHAGRGNGWQASLVKTSSTTALALAGAAMGAPGWILAGLALGALGDFALSRPGLRWFLTGMAAFAAGHLAYVIAFLTDFGGVSLPRLTGLALICGLIALVASTESWLAPHAGALRWPVRGYAVVIGMMAVTAVLLPPGREMLQLGAAAFLLSDVILSIRLFRLTGAKARLLASLALWPLYWGGQALILLGADG